MATGSNLFTQITQISSQTILKTHCIQGYMAGPGLCGYRLQSAPTDSNLWEQIRICGNILQSVLTDANLLPQIRICGHRLQSIPTDSNLFPQIRISGHRLV